MVSLDTRILSAGTALSCPPVDNATLALPNFVPPLRAQCFELFCAAAILLGSP